MLQCGLTLKPGVILLASKKKSVNLRKRVKSAKMPEGYYISNDAFSLNAD